MPTWLLFVGLTILCWGMYGNFMHAGSMKMADPQLGRIKSFLWVGVAYCVTAVILPAVYIMAKNGSWKMPPAGVMWSLLGGTAGAVGAFGAILGLGAAFDAQVKPAPLIVMSLIFAGAPLVSALHSLVIDPAAVKYIRFPFVLGAVMAVGGGYLCARFKPTPPPPPKAAAAVTPTGPGVRTSGPAMDTSKYKVS
jgi:hypothetical protein